MKSFLFSLLLLSTAATSADWSGNLALQYRAFSQSPAFPGQEGNDFSFSFSPEFYHRWDDGSQSVLFKPFIRWDQQDSRRTHADIRELQWIRAGDGWELRAGVGKVFWGVTEAWHLVDIINQTDLVENVDGEQKLGQPMLKLSRESEWGIVDLFVLPYFRERRFPGEAGRFRPALPVDHSLVQYESSERQRHVDLALRWSHYIDDLDIALSHFHGTGREPTLLAGVDGGGQPVLIPHYEIIDQTGLELQLTRADWLWKMEAIHRSGQGESFWAATGGFEYTLVGVADTDADLGLLLEVMLDERGDGSSTPFNHDLFAGLRWTANDVQGSELLGGIIVDWESQAKSFNLEASRRLGNAWKLSLQARAWFDVPPSDGMAAFSRDDYAELELVRYF